MAVGWGLELRDVPRRLNLPFRLAAAGCLDDNVHAPERRPRREFTLGFLLDARAPVRHFHGTADGGEREIVCGGEFPLLSVALPGERHWSETAAGWDEIYLCYEPESVAWWRGAGFGLASGLRKLTLTRRFRQLFGEFREAGRQIGREGAADRLDGIALQIMMELALPGEALLPPDKMSQGVAGIARHFQRHFHAPLDLNALLKRFGVSRRTFYREWGLAFQATPHQFILERRLNFARELLLAARLDIGEIAAASGFADAGSLGRAFRKRWGETPGSCRARHREAPGR